MMTNPYQKEPIVGQQKAKEFSCHTPLTKDEKRNSAVGKLNWPLLITDLDAT
jgi:hypothetical protein